MMRNGSVPGNPYLVKLVDVTNAMLAFMRPALCDTGFMECRNVRYSCTSAPPRMPPGKEETYLENLFKMRPLGVVSKKLIGDRKMA